MDIKFGVDMTSSGRLTRVFRELARLTSSPRKLMKTVADEVVARSKGRFKTKVSPDGERWKEWSDGYAATREGSHSLNMSTGDMEKGIQARVSGRTVAIGVEDAPYAPFADAERPFMGLSTRDEGEIMAMIEEQVQEAINVAA